MKSAGFNNRAILVVLAVLCLVIANAAYIVAKRMERNREHEFSLITTKGSQIVSALDKYYAQNGEYPQLLSQLAPVYISEIPTLGLAKTNEFKYERIRTIDAVGAYTLSIDFPAALRPNGLTLMYSPYLETTGYYKKHQISYVDCSGWKFFAP
ncbi:MAG: hypothetical protein IT366_22350 [Candidatus Hydrogenedentes bacterium]|nr:hypothetical protein [Candidatus Hydrogenedentota bacterium]